MYDINDFFSGRLKNPNSKAEIEWANRQGRGFKVEPNAEIYPLAHNESINCSSLNDKLLGCAFDFSAAWPSVIAALGAMPHNCIINVKKDGLRALRLGTGHDGDGMLVDLIGMINARRKGEDYITASGKLITLQEIKSNLVIGIGKLTPSLETEQKRRAAGSEVEFWALGLCIKAIERNAFKAAIKAANDACIDHIYARTDGVSFIPMGYTRTQWESIRLIMHKAFCRSLLKVWPHADCSQIVLKLDHEYNRCVIGDNLQAIFECTEAKYAGANVYENSTRMARWLDNKNNNTLFKIKGCIRAPKDVLFEQKDAFYRMITDNLAPAFHNKQDNLLGFIDTVSFVAREGVDLETDRPEDYKCFRYISHLDNLPDLLQGLTVGALKTNIQFNEADGFHLKSSSMASRRLKRWLQGPAKKDDESVRIESFDDLSKHIQGMLDGSGHVVLCCQDRFASSFIYSKLVSILEMPLPQSGSNRKESNYSISTPQALYHDLIRDKLCGITIVPIYINTKPPSKTKTLSRGLDAVLFDGIYLVCESETGDEELPVIGIRDFHKGLLESKAPILISPRLDGTIPPGAVYLSKSPVYTDASEVYNQTNIKDDEFGFALGVPSIREEDGRVKATWDTIYGEQGHVCEFRKFSYATDRGFKHKTIPFGHAGIVGCEDTTQTLPKKVGILKYYDKVSLMDICSKILSMRSIDEIMTYLSTLKSTRSSGAGRPKGSDKGRSEYVSCYAWPDGTFRMTPTEGSKRTTKKKELIT